jgi:hypothetical protein
VKGAGEVRARAEGRPTTLASIGKTEYAPAQMEASRVRCVGRLTLAAG